MTSDRLTTVDTEARRVWSRDTGTESVRGRLMTVYRNRPADLAALRRSVPELPPSLPALSQSGVRLDRGLTDSAVIECGRALSRRGVGAGDMVGLFAANTLAWMIAFWGLVEIGAVPVLMNGWWSELEARHAIDLVRMRTVVADDRRIPLVPSGVHVVPIDEIPVLPNEVGSRPEPARQPADEDTAGVVLFTSGTTGLPKAVLLPHRAIISRQQSAMDVARRLPVDPRPGYQRVQLLSAPLFHIGPLQQMITSWLTGSKLVLLEGRFDAGEVLRLIQDEEISTWSAVPTMVVRVLAHPDRERTDLSTLRSISVGGARVPDDLRRQIAEHLPGVGTHVAVGYGLTEAAGTVSTPRSPTSASEGSCGEPLPNVMVRIAGPEEELPGEVLVGGPTLMLGYAGQAGQPIDGDGWLHTGDIGEFDSSGQLHITDRAKDIIIRGGENIAAANVESVLDRHPAVLESAVVSLPHPDLGEEVGAVVVLQAGSEVTDRELTRHAADQLATFEVPSKWWIRTEPLPVNTVAKVDKRLVREQWLEAANLPPTIR